MPKNDIPVYLVAGFLDGGKTNFINGILQDGFAREDRTLLICCEEGEEEYDESALGNVTVVYVDEEKDLLCSQLKAWEKLYRPKQVIIEYNGMWQLERLYRDVLPANWVLYQIMTFVQASTFEMYAKNMGQLMMEKIMAADLLIFNRCNEELRAKGIVNGENGWIEFDYVPEEHEIRAGHPDYTGRLCVIGAELDEGKLKTLFGL